MSLTKVTTNGLTDETIDAGKIADGGLANADIAPGTITSAKLAGSITNAKLANESITINSSATALGASLDTGKISWQSVVTGDTTMVAGRGYFVNTTSSAVTMTLPSSAAAGDTIIIKDYAANFGTNKVTIARNSHNIQGVANDSEIKTNRAAVKLVYVDATKGWLYATESNVNDLTPTFINATGGTVTTSGDFKIHTFTGDGNFVVASVGNCAVEPAANKNKVDYVVVAGGGGGAGNDGNDNGQGGGGAGGFRESPGASTGGGGAGGTAAHDNGTKGSNSVFSTITSTGGGFGSHQQDSGPDGGPGGSGGGGGAGSNPSPSVAGSGNTPPVNPPQGSNGGTGFNAGLASGGGGGGATSAGGNVGPPGVPGGAGGNGATTSITGSAVTYAGGGGGAAAYGGTCKQGAGGPGGGGAAGADNTAAGTAGTANKGGGGGAGGARTAPSQPTSPGTAGGAGGSGVVIIRYKFQ
jgi:hypothetical protein